LKTVNVAHGVAQRGQAKAVAALLASQPLRLVAGEAAEVVREDDGLAGGIETDCGHAQGRRALTAGQQ
jgi:hypothetical protein